MMESLQYKRQKLEKLRNEVNILKVKLGEREKQIESLKTENLNFFE